MTDSNEESGGLPTAAYEWRYVDWDEGHTVLRHDKPNRDSFDVELELKHKLVRKSDVNALIQEAVEHELEKVRDSLLMVTDKGGGTDRYRERLQQGLTYRMENLDVEELLEELEQ